MDIAVAPGHNMGMGRGPLAMNANGATVLVVDDERHTARLFEYILGREGYRVAVAHDGDAAWREAQRLQPAAVLLDLELPGRSGAEVLRLIRADAELRQIAVVVLTAKTFDELPNTAREGGPDAHCTKPVAPSRLLQVLADLKVLPRAGSRP